MALNIMDRRKMFKPLGNYVLIEPIELPDTTPSGLVLPESSKDRPNQGKVIAVGEGILLENGTLSPVRVWVGDTVLFQKYSGIEFKMDSKKFLIMRDTELLGTLSE